MNISEETKNKNIKDKKIIILFILIVSIIILLFTKVALLATPKKIFDTSLNKVFKTLNETATNKQKNISGNLDLEINIDSNQNNELFDIINNLNLKTTYEFDQNNNKINLGIKSSYKDKELIIANMYLKDKNAYLSLDNIFDKYIQIPLEDYSEIFKNKNSTEDYKIIIAELEKALNKAIKNKYFTSEKSSLTIDDKKINLTKNILKMNKENQKLIYKDIAKNLNNEKFIKSVSNITNKDQSTIKKNIENIINEDLKIDNDYTISIYTKGLTKEFKAFEIKDKENTLLITKENNQTFNYSFNINNSEKFYGTFSIKNNNNYSLQLNLEIKDIKISFQLKSSHKYNGTIKDLDITNYIPYDKLTEKDQEQITKNFFKSEGVSELIEAYQKLFWEYSQTSF